MKSQYLIQGMTCGGCVAKVKKALLSTPEINSAEVQLESPQASIEFSEKLSDEQLNTILKKTGDYSIQHAGDVSAQTDNLPEATVTTYKPLILIVTFIFGVSLLAQYPFQNFSWMVWMRYFMAGFFIVFSFFKLLNIEGFATSYRMYDIIAEKWKTWGYLYPFVELVLGVAYLINFQPVLTYVATILVLGVSSIGVIRSNLQKQKIKCACLGDVFNLPMSTVTTIEDLTMVFMAVMMLIV